MSSSADRTRNNVRAGIFVTALILLALAVTLVLSDVRETWFQPRHTYTVIFPVRDGIGNLHTGAEVRVGGVPMGQVTDIRHDFDSGPAVQQIEVDIEIDRRVQLFQGATVQVGSALIGSEGWLDIPSVGRADEGEPPGRTIEGTSAGLLAMLLGAEGEADARATISSVRRFGEFLEATPEQWEREVMPIFRDLGATSEDIAALSADLREQRWATWMASVDSVMNWASGATSDIDAALAQAEGLFEDGRSLINDSRDDVGAIIDNVKLSSANVEETARWIREDLTGRIEGFLGRGEEALASADGAINNLSASLDEWTPNLSATLGNANLASQQLKLAMIEIRRSPWKVLYRPTADELQHEFLYNAARSFLMAAADLNAASQTVERVLENHGDRLAGDETSMQRLHEMLMDSLERYERAQQDMIDVIVADSE